ncbi:MAG: DUF433 domain-containing protein [Tannerella sp.]|jgi:uncharacterized protein (DUF433 family)|nr:DUF433 domain-containing protein [Tannerella sp.]
MDNLFERITIDKRICSGKPSIRGMRFTVSHMLELIASGMTTQEILHDYPYIEPDDISACLYYASGVMSNRNMLLIEDIT